jgi:hypothetical protein
MAEVLTRNKTVKDEVTKLRSRFLDLGFCFQDQELESMSQELLETF